MKLVQGMVVLCDDKSFLREFYTTLLELNAVQCQELEPGVLVFIWGNIVDKSLPTTSLILVRVAARNPSSITYECNQFRGELWLNEFGCDGDPRAIRLKQKKELGLLMLMYSQKFILPQSSGGEATTGLVSV